MHVLLGPLPEARLLRTGRLVGHHGHFCGEIGGPTGGLDDLLGDLLGDPAPLLVRRVLDGLMQRRLVMQRGVAHVEQTSEGLAPF